jgi:hypothetical protein
MQEECSSPSERIRTKEEAQLMPSRVAQEAAKRSAARREADNDRSPVIDTDSTTFADDFAAQIFSKCGLRLRQGWECGDDHGANGLELSREFHAEDGSLVREYSFEYMAFRWEDDDGYPRYDEKTGSFQIERKHHMDWCYRSCSNDVLSNGRELFWTELDADLKRAGNAF